MHNSIDFIYECFITLREKEYKINRKIRKTPQQQRLRKIMDLTIQSMCSFVDLYQANKQHNSLTDLYQYLEKNRDDLLNQLHHRGIIIFRGFKLENTEQFHQLVTEALKLTPWNAFNPSLPAWFASWMRKYSEGLLGSGDYRRYLDKNTVQLGPVENSIQGPHTEGGIRSVRSRYLALYCQEPSHYLAETGFNDLQKIWSLLGNKQEKYQNAWNRFFYISDRKLNFIDHLLLKKSPFTIKMLENKTAKLSLPICPLVIRHPETGELSIQPWAFANNTNKIVHQAAKHSFKNRGEIEVDSTAEGMNLTWELCQKNGTSLEWNTTEQQELFNLLYKDALLLQWQKGDFALVDNIKIAHWRMNGKQGNRKLIQIQTNVFDAQKYTLEA